MDSLSGPSLGLIYNKKMGSDPFYTRYSNIMIEANLFWTEKNLFKFLKNPQ